MSLAHLSRSLGLRPQSEVGGREGAGGDRGAFRGHRGEWTG